MKEPNRESHRTSLENKIMEKMEKNSAIVSEAMTLNDEEEKKKKIKLTLEEEEKMLRTVLSCVSKFGIGQEFFERLRSFARNQPLRNLLRSLLDFIANPQVPPQAPPIEGVRPNLPRTDQLSEAVPSTSRGPQPSTSRWIGPNVSFALVQK